MSSLVTPLCLALITASLAWRRSSIARSELTEGLAENASRMLLTRGPPTVMSILTAILWRGASGQGQHVDVSLHAAANVTTEAGSYVWLVARLKIRTKLKQPCSVPHAPEIKGRSTLAWGRILYDATIPHVKRHSRDAVCRITCTGGRYRLQRGRYVYLFPRVIFAVELLPEYPRAVIAA